MEWEALKGQVMEEEYGYTNDPDGYLILKIAQLIELLVIRHCIFMMGPPGSFKSAVWRILAKSKDRLGDKMFIVDYNPKAFTTNEVYGYPLWLKCIRKFGGRLKRNLGCGNPRNSIELSRSDSKELLLMLFLDLIRSMMFQLNGLDESLLLHFTNTFLAS